MLIILIAGTWMTLMIVFLAICKVAAHGDLAPIEAHLIEVEAGIFVESDEVSRLGLRDQRGAAQREQVIATSGS
ncbi:MAG TPA: hypothetical protein VID48_12820 [Solirubrobacteraceae bacterium]|jgi:hypothetical protein